MNLVHAVAEARASRVPLLALVGEPPADLQGRGAFQDTSGKDGGVDALAVFGAAAKRALRVETARDVPAALDRAVQGTHAEEPGPVVMLLAKNVQTADIGSPPPLATEGAPERAPEPADIEAALDALGARPVVVIAGPEVVFARAEQDLEALAAVLGAGVATTPDARDAFDNRSPRFLGLSGAMGHPAVARAVAAAGTVVLAGTSLPLLARQGIEPLLRDKTLVTIASRGYYLSGSREIHLKGAIGPILRTLAARAAPSPAADEATPRFDSEPDEPSDELTAAAVARAVDRIVPAGSVLLVDAGNTGACGAHYLKVPEGGRFIIAMGMAGMGYTFGAATGAACATGKRCFVLAGDGAFFMNGMEIHTAVEHRLPITYVLFDNGAHGMCLVRERLLLGENTGYNVFRRSRLGAGLAAMFPGLASADCETLAEVGSALERSLRTEGPSVVCARLKDVEVPPFSAFREKAPHMRVVPRS